MIVKTAPPLRITKNSKGPMEEIDTNHGTNEYDDEEMFLREVIQDDHELLFLDSYLKEALGGGNTI